MSRTNFLNDINLKVVEPTPVYNEKTEKQSQSIDSHTQAIIEAYENKTNSDPYNCNLLLEYSQFLVKNSCYSKAINILLKLIDIDKNHKEGLRLLFYSYDHENKFYEAIKIGEKLKVIDENNHRLFYCLSELNFENGRIDYALKYLKKSIEIDNENDEYWRFMAYLQSVVGNNKGAFKAWKEVLRIDPENDTAKMNLAIALATNGQHEKANELFSSINTKNSQSEIESDLFIPYYLWNSIQLNLPNVEIDKIIHRHDINAATIVDIENNDIVTVIYEYLGGYFSKNEKFGEAIKIFKKAYDISHSEIIKNKIIYNYIALSNKYRANGNIHETAASLKEGLAFDPDNATIQKKFKDVKKKQRRKRYLIVSAIASAILLLVGLSIIYYHVH